MKNQISVGSSTPKASTKGHRMGLSGSSKDNGVKKPKSPVMDYPWPEEKSAKIK